MKIWKIFAVLMVLALAPASGWAAPVGELATVEGSVDLIHPGQAAIPAEQGFEVSVGDNIRTKKGARAVIRFVDKSEIYVSESSRLEIAEYLFENNRTQATINLLRGKIQSMVNKTSQLFGLSRPNRFEVHTRTAVVGVRGTNFFSYYGEDGMSGAMFIEGKGYCYAKDKPDILRDIIAGQAMTVNDSWLPPVIRPVTETEIRENLQDTQPDYKTWNGDNPESGENERAGLPVEDHHSKEGNRDAEGDSVIVASEGNSLPGEKGERAGQVRSALQNNADGEAFMALFEDDDSDYLMFADDERPAGKDGNRPDGAESDHYIILNIDGAGDVMFMEFGEGNENGPLAHEMERWIDDVFSGESSEDGRPGELRPVSEQDPYALVAEVFENKILAEMFHGSTDSGTFEFELAGTMFGEIKGVDRLWNATPDKPSSFMLTGAYTDPYEKQNPASTSVWYANTLFSFNFVDGQQTTFDGGAYQGFMGGLRYGNELTGLGLALFTDPDGNTGILKSETSVGGFNQTDSRFSAQGNIFPVKLSWNTGFSAAAFMDHIVINEYEWAGPENLASGWFPDAEGSISISEIYQEIMQIEREPWAVAFIGNGGTWTGETVPAQWVLPFKNTETGQEWLRAYSTTGNTAASDMLPEEVSGTACMAWVDINQALTGVGGGDFVGTFDPNQYTWQMVEAWAMMDTNRFLEMTRSDEGRRNLAGLNIPAVEIGKTTLTGTSDAMNVTLKDVTFFSYSTGGNPSIWATGDVSGTFQATPDAGYTVGLSGGGLNADFTVTNWNTDTWGASVNGSGTLSRTDIAGTVSTEFSGYAAGTHTADGTLSGTASGLAN